MTDDPDTRSRSGRRRFRDSARSRRSAFRRARGSSSTPASVSRRRGRGALSRRADERHHTYLFAIDDDIVIDAAVDGNEARFINHSAIRIATR